MLRNLHTIPVTLYIALAIATFGGGAFGLYLAVMGGAMAIDSQGHLPTIGAGAARFAGGVFLMHITSTIFMHALNIQSRDGWNWMRGLSFMGGGSLAMLGVIALLVGLVGLQDVYGIIGVLFLQGQPVPALIASVPMLIIGGLIMEKSTS